MLKTIKIYEATGTDPYENLAVEQYMLEHLAPDEGILYLWQNKNTVVIGKNQNPWSECHVDLLEEEGGRIARRLSGGGAVFHDLGNLNFTFIFHDQDYDVAKQLSVIAHACGIAGIKVEKSGRNDVLAEGRKFSGNAFYHAKGRSYHHGTLLIASDMDKLQRYLNPPAAKLAAKGVSSVRSRVVNLSELAPELTIDSMKAYMRKAVGAVYGVPTQEYILNDVETIQQLRRKNSSWDHLFGSPLPFTYKYEGYFPWGFIELRIQSDRGVIQAVQVYTDSMDWTLPQTLEKALTGCKFKKPVLLTALYQTLPQQQAQDIASLL